MEFAYDGGGPAKGGDVTLYYDGKAVGSGRVEHTHPMIFSADETTDIGEETGTTVTPDYTARDSRFTGKINWVQLDARHRRSRPLHRSRGAPPHRHGPAVMTSEREPRSPESAARDSSIARLGRARAAAQAAQGLARLHGSHVRVHCRHRAHLVGSWGLARPRRARADVRSACGAVALGIASAPAPGRPVAGAGAGRDRRRDRLQVLHEAVGHLLGRSSRSRPSCTVASAPRPPCSSS